MCIHCKKITHTVLILLNMGWKSSVSKFESTFCTTERSLSKPIPVSMWVAGRWTMLLLGFLKITNVFKRWRHREKLFFIIAWRSFEKCVRLPFIWNENDVPQLHNRIVSVDESTRLGSIRADSIEVDFCRGAARTDWAHLPEILRFEWNDAVVWQSASNRFFMFKPDSSKLDPQKNYFCPCKTKFLPDSFPNVFGFIIRRNTQFLWPSIVSDVESSWVDSDHIAQKSPRHSTRFFLEKWSKFRNLR